MAWVSAKVYAILSKSNEGKDIIEQLPDLTQDECDDLVDEFFSNSGKGASSNADYLKAKEDDEFEAQAFRNMDNKEVNEEDDDLPWWDKPDKDEVKQAYGDKDDNSDFVITKGDTFGLEEHHLDEIETLAENANMPYSEALEIIGKETEEMVDEGLYDLEDAYAIARDNFIENYGLNDNGIDLESLDNDKEGVIELYKDFLSQGVDKETAIDFTVERWFDDFNGTIPEEAYEKVENIIKDSKKKLKKSLEMKTNKFYSNLYNKVFEGNNDFTESDKEFVLRMFENNDNPEKFVEEIKNTDYYKRMKEKADKIPFINPNDEKIITKASQEFLSQITKGKTGDNFKKKQIVVITGLPGAGKSSEEIRPFLENSIELDNDIAKAVPTFANSYQNGLGAGKVHKASKKAEQMAMQQLIKEGYNVVIPMIGDDEDSILRRTLPFIEAGYEAPLLIHKEISNDESRKRAFKRGIETGRFIDDDVIKEYGNSSNETHERLKKNKGVYKKDGKEYKFRIYEEKNR